jgi:hypothetical protein
MTAVLSPTACCPSQSARVDLVPFLLAEYKRHFYTGPDFDQVVYITVRTLINVQAFHQLSCCSCAHCS